MDFINFRLSRQRHALLGAMCVAALAACTQGPDMSGIALERQKPVKRYDIAQALAANGQSVVAGTQSGACWFRQMRARAGTGRRWEQSPWLISPFARTRAMSPSIITTRYGLPARLATNGARLPSTNRVPRWRSLATRKAAGGWWVSMPRCRALVTRAKPGK